MTRLKRRKPRRTNARHQIGHIPNLLTALPGFGPKSVEKMAKNGPKSVIFRHKK